MISEWLIWRLLVEAIFIVLSEWENIWPDRAEDFYKTMVIKRPQGTVFQFCVLLARPSQRIRCACKKYLCPCSLCLDDDSSYSDDFVCRCDLGRSDVHFHLQPTSMLDLSAEAAVLFVEPNTTSDGLDPTVHSVPPISGYHVQGKSAATWSFLAVHSTLVGSSSSLS